MNNVGFEYEKPWLLLGLLAYFTKKKLFESYSLLESASEFPYTAAK
jgi:hypothetical protein